MKKIIALFLTVLLTVSLCGCGSPAAPQSGKLSVVTTIFPEYDWVMQILGDRADGADVTMLLDSGVDLHSYQPTADDIVRIAQCDLFIYVGGESDAWVKDALAQSANPSRITVNLLETLGDAVKEEETVEGMEAEADSGAEEEPEYDEHVWLSLKNAKILINAVCGALVSLDAENADGYTANASAYVEKLDALDARYQSAADAAKIKTVLFADRFPFRYLTDDYGLNYYAAFAGCSAESEASFETVAFLAGKVDELGLTSVLTLEGTDHRIAETVIAATSGKNARILAMDSMQSVTSADVKNGASYLAVMEKNLSVLTDALQ